nr:MAG TPA: hypothetical protein [Caudoviricetes sp.]
MSLFLHRRMVVSLELLYLKADLVVEQIPIMYSSSF